MTYKIYIQGELMGEVYTEDRLKFKRKYAKDKKVPKHYIRMIRKHRGSYGQTKGA